MIPIGVIVLKNDSTLFNTDRATALPFTKLPRTARTLPSRVDDASVRAYEWPPQCECLPRPDLLRAQPSKELVGNHHLRLPQQRKRHSSESKAFETVSPDGSAVASTRRQAAGNGRLSWSLNTAFRDGVTTSSNMPPGPRVLPE